MKNRRVGKRIIILAAGMVAGLLAAGVALAANPSGIGALAHQVTTNMEGLAKLITAGSYVAGFGFVVAAIVKFKAHKDNPAQVTLSVPVVMLFIGAALIFVPSVFQVTGGTMGLSGKSSVSGVSSF